MTNVINNKLAILKKIANQDDCFSINQQIELVKKISTNQLEAYELMEFLIERRIKTHTELSCIDGIIFKNLYDSKIVNLKDKINTYFKEGVVKLESSKNINYYPLYKSLISNNFKEANFLTQIYLQELAGLKKNNKRQWLYFTDIIKLPSKDLKTIDALWRIYSEGKFGFSIQRNIWLYNDQNWDKLWNLIGWKINDIAIRYPNEFIWDHTAPKGHLPLFNQLRGVQVIATLFKHPAWQNTRSQK
uniref:Conserved hypothetical plastid protein n=1 Tax=Calliarthron tuberculosum TaxID=48942 RepID=M4IUV7_CALTB|nr:conserved hypothetical plastid protein [Calliarthron tuberculosum]AGA63759.1 conserved hypothetical plastid protein [Calliarthron tuberculosum]